MATDNPSLLPIIPPSDVYDRLPLNSLVPSSWDAKNNAKFQPKNKMLWSLFVRALSRMQNRDPSKDDSYFQLSGTHGYPFVEWAKRNRTVNVKSKPYGYCAHSQVLFPTWHRITTVAFEQVLLRDAVDIAKEYNPPTYHGLKWTDVANELRLPYWDWAACLGKPPPELFGGEKVDVLNEEGKFIGYEVKSLGDNVKVIGDDGIETEFLNPLLRYRFPENYITELEDPDEKLDKDLKEKLIKFSKWPTTIRNPDIHFNEDVAGMLEKFHRAADQISLKTFMMFLFAYPRWEFFSNNGRHNDMIGLHNNSIEAIHDDIHMLSGKGHSLNGVYVQAHMTDLTFAAFDPLFWFHHANVDRLLSLWQVLNPTTWVSPGHTREPSMGWKSGEAVDEKTALEPFYQKSGKPWTSDLLRNTHQLGYSYPDLSQEGAALYYDRQKNPASSIASMFNHVKALYGYPLSVNEKNQAVITFAEFFGKRNQPSKEFAMYSWGIHASFKRYEAKDSFVLIFYFADGARWDDEGYYIGSINAFHGLTPETCSNCKANKDIYQEGYVPLTYLLARSIEWDTTYNPSITKRTEKDFSEPEKVILYLKERKLTYRLEGTEVSQLESLKIHLQAERLHIPAVIDPGAEETAEPPVVVDTGRTYLLDRDSTEFRMKAVEDGSGTFDATQI